MIKKEKIASLIQQGIEGTEIFLVSFSIGGDNKIFVRIDKPYGISLEECQTLSKFIENNLDREIEDFDLEVSSPGIGEPLKVIEQFNKCINKFVCVLSKNGEKKQGILLNIQDDEIEIEAEEKVQSENSKKKVIQKNLYKYNINNIVVKEIISLK